MSDTLTPHLSGTPNSGVGPLALHVLDGVVRPDPDGLVSYQSVIDALLDLRNVLDVGGRGVVDHLMVSVPGVNVVESNWWLGQIGALEELFASWDERAS